MLKRIERQNQRAGEKAAIGLNILSGTKKDDRMPKEKRWANTSGSLGEFFGRVSRFIKKPAK